MWQWYDDYLCERQEKGREKADYKLYEKQKLQTRYKLQFLLC